MGFDPLSGGDTPCHLNLVRLPAHPLSLFQLFRVQWLDVHFTHKLFTFRRGSENGQLERGTPSSCWCDRQGTRNGMNPINHPLWCPFFRNPQVHSLHEPIPVGHSLLSFPKNQFPTYRTQQVVPLPALDPGYPSTGFSEPNAPNASNGESEDATGTKTVQGRRVEGGEGHGLRKAGGPGLT